MTTLAAKYSPYPAYRPAGVPWLGEIPAHWDITAIKNQFSIQLGKMLQNSPSDIDDLEVPYLKAVNVQWFRVQTSEPSTMWANQKEIELFGIQKGDLLVCEGGEGGRCGIVEEDVDGYIIQNALHRVRPIKDSRNDFLEYVLSTVSASGWFDALNERATIAHFTGEKFSALRMPLPPLPEQRAIAAFLDRETARIDALVARKERLIELLREKRAALITRAVTRGLEPNAPMQDSGVPWLGEIPAHWEVPTLKWHSRCHSGKGLSANDVSSEPFGEVCTPVIGGNGVMGFTDRENSNETVLAIGRVGALCGNVHIVDAPAWITDNALVLSVRPDFASLKYLASVLRARNLNDVADKTAQPLITASRVLNERIPLPPLPEQQAIAEFLDRETARLDALVARVHDAIERLRELRMALISAAVTGRIDVREEAG